MRNRKTGEIFLIDAKDVLKLRIKELNERLAYPEIAEKGAVVTGKGWSTREGRGEFPVGMKIPPTKVQIQTPKGAYQISPSASGNRLPLVPWKASAGRLDDIGSP
ncbi:MAG: hypothetical protein E6G95_21200 [Alphaproteobacteria bacterium]|nr:MAG: hypothetical protein E6G95_21200 [Alphaproteobacteria bacterium]